MTKNDEMTARLERALRSLGGEAIADGMLVGFSGGADSSALLSMLASLRDRGALPDGTRLLALHVHHGLRGGAADGDEAFCRSFCAARGIEYQVIYGDVRAMAARLHTGIEDAGRRFRYACFERVRREKKLRCVLTAHQGDDQTETVLLHLLRGCGSEGLRGIPGRSALPGGGLLLRPLLAFSGEELRDYCLAESIDYRVDGSNADPAFLRSALRGRVIPSMEELQPGLRENIRRMTALLSSDAEYLRARAEEAMTLPEEKWADLPDALLSRVLQRRFRDASLAIFGGNVPGDAVRTGEKENSPEMQWKPLYFSDILTGFPAKQANSAKDTDFALSADFSTPWETPDAGRGYANLLPMEAVERLAALLRTGKPFRLSLPGGITAWRIAAERDEGENGTKKGQLRLFFVPDGRFVPRGKGIPLYLGENPLPGFPARMKIEKFDPSGEIPGEIPEGRSRKTGGAKVRPSKNKESFEKVYRFFIKIPFPFDTIQRRDAEGTGDRRFAAPLPLFCRAPLPGERRISGGRARPLRELLRDAGVPLPLRDGFPLVCGAGGVPFPSVLPGGTSPESGTFPKGGIFPKDGASPEDGTEDVWLSITLDFPKTVTGNL